jgi:hypothetical protein
MPAGKVKGAFKNFVFVVLLVQRSSAHPVHAGMRDVLSLWAGNKVKTTLFLSVL